MVGCSEGGSTGEVVLVGVTGEGESCAALRRAVLGRRSSGLGVRVGGRRWVGVGRETAVVEVRRPNP